MKRQFHPLLRVREQKAEQLIAESSDNKTREKARNELAMYLSYRRP